MLPTAWSQEHTNGGMIKLSFSNIHTNENINRLIAFLDSEFIANSEPSTHYKYRIEQRYLRQKNTHLPSYSNEELREYYGKLQS